MPDTPDVLPPPGERKEKEEETRERFEALNQLEDWLETPVTVLGFFWLVLIIIDLTRGLTPFLNAVMLFIWGVFLVDFLLRLFLAPDKLNYLRRNWLTALSLFIPALRIGRLARLVRLVRAARGARLVSVIGSFNRGMRVLRRTLERHQFGYISLLTLVVVLIGAAGMYAFERAPAAGSDSQAGLSSYGEALWWTGMIMTTLGSEYWPHSAEGRMLALLLSIYALAMFGYITATLATFFIGQDAQPEQNPTAEPVLDDTGALADEVRALRAEIADLRREIQSRDRGPSA